MSRSIDFEIGHERFGFAYKPDDDDDYYDLVVRLMMALPFICIITSFTMMHLMMILTIEQQPIKHTY